MNECLDNDDDDEEAHSRSPSCFFTTPCISDADTGEHTIHSSGCNLFRYTIGMCPVSADFCVDSRLADAGRAGDPMSPRGSDTAHAKDASTVSDSELPLVPTTGSELELCDDVPSLRKTPVKAKCKA